MSYIYIKFLVEITLYARDNYVGVIIARSDISLSRGHHEAGIKIRHLDRNVATLCDGKTLMPISLDIFCCSIGF